MRFIPFSVPTIGHTEIHAVIDVLKSGWLTTGKITLRFEELFAKHIGCKYAIAVNSCTSALHLSLKCINIKPTDEVITTPFTFASTANTIVHCGAKPVFVDIDPVNFCIDPDKIKKAITQKTKAIVVIHYGGAVCDMNRINNLAKRFNLKVIEDAAHATGASYSNNRKVGNSDNLTCFSFYSIKNMTTGEGGMVTVNNKRYAQRIRLLSLHGLSRDAWKRYRKTGSWYYEIIEAGYKYNMTDIQSAIGICQLKKLNKFNTIRKRYALYFYNELKNIDEMQLQPFYHIKMKGRVWHLFTIRLNRKLLNIRRDEFINQMYKNKIACSVHFIPLHLHPFYKRFGYRKGDFPVAEDIYNSIVSIPLYPRLNLEKIRYIIKRIKTIVKTYRK
jgi:dTDP-4-amino-4,6-dideoxygalactose transaminase